MRFLRPGRPSAVLVVSIIALILALGGTSYAAFVLPKNSVGTSLPTEPASATSELVNGYKLANPAWGDLSGSYAKPAIGVPLSSPPAVTPRRRPARQGRAIPAGLVRAIRARLGAGPIGLGAAPRYSGIAPVGKDWAVQARSHSLSAQISATGAVRAVLWGRARASLRAVGLDWGLGRSTLSVRGSSLVDGRLVQDLGVLSSAWRVTAGGLEQSFTVRRPLRGAGRLAVVLGSPQRWRVIRQGSAIIPVGGAYGPLAYAGLRVTDARGRLLGSRFVTGADGMRIVVDVTDARYPVRIDPTWTTTSTPTATLTTNARTANDALGLAVALSADGTTALIGAPGVNNSSSQRGAAYVFHVSADGSWSSSSIPAATLTNGPGFSGDAVGLSVALSADGTTALVGAPGVGGFAGAAYVFHVSGEGSWASSSSPTATLTNSGGSENDGFGWSVKLSSDGSTALIGAPGVSTKTGAAYVFHVSGEGSWASSSSPTATLINSGGSEHDDLGWSVALSSGGTTALIGAPRVGNLKGAAYVFHVSGEGLWSSSGTPTAALTDGGGSDGDELGVALALSADGTTALIGAPYVNGSSLGAAYIFHVSGATSWSSSSTPTATLTDSTGYSLATMGSDVSLSADGATALIGAPGPYTSGNGAAYAFHVPTEGSWSSSATPTARLTNSAGSTGDRLGAAVALSADGTTALIGAPRVSSKGAAYVFRSRYYKVNPPTPQLGGMTLNPIAFRAATNGPAVGGGSGTGTTIRYHDTLRARSTFRVLRCIGKHGRCTRLVTIGFFTHDDRRGANRLHFTGRLHGRALMPGHYMLRVIATLTRRRSRPVSRRFVILSSR